MESNRGITVNVGTGNLSITKALVEAVVTLQSGRTIGIVSDTGAIIGNIIDDYAFWDIQPQCCQSDSEPSEYSWKWRVNHLARFQHARNTSRKAINANHKRLVTHHAKGKVAEPRFKFK